MGAPRCHARRVLSEWCEDLRRDPRLIGWEVTFEPGGDWPGSGSRVLLDHPPIFADLAAWPSGTIDTQILVDGLDAETQWDHADVTNDRDLATFAASFTDGLLLLAASVGRR